MIPALLLACGVNNFMMPLKRNKSPQVSLDILKMIFGALDPEDHKASSGVPIRDAARYLQTGTANSSCLQQLISHCSCRAASRGSFIAAPLHSPKPGCLKPLNEQFPSLLLQTPKAQGLKSPTPLPCPGQGSWLGLATTAISWLHPPCTAGAVAGCRGELLIAQEQLGQGRCMAPLGIRPVPLDPTGPTSWWSSCISM